MNKNNINNKIIDSTCEVCGKTIEKDIYGQGKCPYCGWRNCFMNAEHPDNVLHPNLISLNKAKRLYLEKKPLEPDLDDFVEALHAYGEVQFIYNNVCYAVELLDSEINSTQIQLYNTKTKEVFVFKNDNDFKTNARIENKLLKDIWNETTDRYWLQ